MTIALTILKAIGWRGLVLIGALAALSAWHLHGISAAKESGRVEVRQQWAEAQRRADLKQIAKVEAQQKQINAADAALVEMKDDLGSKVEELREALTEEAAKNALQKPETTVAGNSGSACRPMPERVRGALNAIGRAKPRS
ncbi:secretion protein HylD [Agrobacterium vitis]